MSPERAEKSESLLSWKEGEAIGDRNVALPYIFKQFFLFWDVSERPVSNLPPAVHL